MTVGTTFLLGLVLRPHKIKSLQVIGLSGAPTVSAIPRCNYILAFIEEVLRCSSVIDFTFLHRGTKPVVHLGGHAITDDKLLIGNIWAVHNNPDLWEEPEKFRPERFD